MHCAVGAVVPGSRAIGVRSGPSQAVPEIDAVNSLREVPNVRAVQIPAFIAALVLATSAAAQDVPWRERHELVLSPWLGPPANAERFAKAEVLWTSKWAFADPNCPGSAAFQCALEVIRWSQACDEGEGDCPQDLCPATTPFYAQPTPTHHCSGFLVGEDLILTAGHCMCEIGCADQRFVFDYAVKYPGDPLGVPPPQGGGVKYIPQEDIFACVELAGCESPFAPGTPPDEAFSFGEGAPGIDWALVRLDRPVGADRVPIPTERSTETAVGDYALMLGHPWRIPLKAEIQQISGYSGSGLAGPFSALHGNSGSGIFNLHTGKAVGIARTGPMALEESAHPSCQALYDLCFTCGNSVGAQGTLTLASVVPKIGLQVTPTLAVHHYGPPTSPQDFPGQLFTLSAPSDPDPAPGQVIRPVTWSTYQEGDGIEMLEVWGGPSSGTLQPGQQTTVTIGPVPGIVQERGLYTASMPFFDQTYFTRSPLVHQLHIGVDGFTTLPADPFDGEYDLGVNDGDARLYRPSNRWSVPQDLTIAAIDPTDPGAPWPQWLEIEDDTVPLSVTLPCKGCGQAPRIDAAVVATGLNLDPGVYESTIVFSSDDSGSPPFEIARKVYFDHCREVFEDLNLPATLELAAFGGEDTHEFFVQPTGPAVIDDVDLVIDMMVEGPGTGVDKYQIRLRSPDPNGVEVVIKDFDDPPQTVYDSETDRPAAGDLSDYKTFSSFGHWVLTARNALDATEALTLSLETFHVRLHHVNAEPCVP